MLDFTCFISDFSKLIKVKIKILIMLIFLIFIIIIFRIILVNKIILSIKIKKEIILLNYYLKY